MPKSVRFISASRLRASSGKFVGRMAGTGPRAVRYPQCAWRAAFATAAATTDVTSGWNTLGTM